MIKTVVLDLDDFSILRSRMDLLLTIKEHYPKFKVSMFTIPYDYEYEMSQLRIQRDEAKELIKKNLSWIQIIPHGLSHLPREFEKADTKATVLALNAINEIFMKEELPYERGFKAPYWLWNKEVVEVLNQRGFWGAVDRDQPNMLRPKKYYVYDYSIDEPFWLSDKETVKLHGHMTLPSKNNLEDCLLNLFKLPNNVEFKYVTDFIQSD